MTEHLHIPKGVEWGALARVTQQGERFPLADSSILIPRSEWAPVSLRPYVWHVINQGSQGSCCAAATAGAVMLIREQAGWGRTILSQASLYAQGNGGRDAGMAIDSALDAMREVGMTPIGTIPQYDWQGMRRGTWPKNWKEIAHEYRVVEWDECISTDMVGSILQRRRKPVIVGVFWQGGGGHAIVVTGWRDGAWEILNSWGEWGDHGFGELSEATLQKGIAYFGAWSPRVTDIPDDEQ